MSFSRLIQGQAAHYLPLMFHCLLVFSKPVAELLIANGHSDLHKQTDYHFVKAVLSQMLPQIFNYDPRLKIDDFFNSGLGEVKLHLLANIV